MRKANKQGCVPSEDVCLKHCEPLLCRHGCSEVMPHKCKDETPHGESRPTGWNGGSNG